MPLPKTPWVLLSWCSDQLTDEYLDGWFAQGSGLSWHDDASETFRAGWADREAMEKDAAADQSLALHAPAED